MTNDTEERRRHAAPRMSNGRFYATLIVVFLLGAMLIQGLTGGGC
jgi:hypothetical protein